MANTNTLTEYAYLSACMDRLYASSYTTEKTVVVFLALTDMTLEALGETT